MGGPLRALTARQHDLRTRVTRAPLLGASRCAGEKGAKPRARGARPIARAPTLAPGSPRATPAAQALERRARADHAVARRPTAARTVRRDPPRALSLRAAHASRACGAIRPRPRRALAARPHTLSTLVGRAQWKYARAPHASQAIDVRVAQDIFRTQICRNAEQRRSDLYAYVHVGDRVRRVVKLTRTDNFTVYHRFEKRRYVPATRQKVYLPALSECSRLAIFAHVNATRAGSRPPRPVSCRAYEKLPDAPSADGGRRASCFARTHMVGGLEMGAKDMANGAKRVAGFCMEQGARPGGLLV